MSSSGYSRREHRSIQRGAYRMFNALREPLTTREQARLLYAIGSMMLLTYPKDDPARQPAVTHLEGMFSALDSMDSVAAQLGVAPALISYDELSKPVAARAPKDEPLYTAEFEDPWRYPTNGPKQIDGLYWEARKGTL